MHPARAQQQGPPWCSRDQRALVLADFLRLSARRYPFFFGGWIPNSSFWRCCRCPSALLPDRLQTVSRALDGSGLNGRSGSSCCDCDASRVSSANRPRRPPGLLLQSVTLTLISASIRQVERGFPSRRSPLFETPKDPPGSAGSGCALFATRSRSRRPGLVCKGTRRSST